MEIRKARPSDRSDIEAVVAAAFGEEADGSVVRMVRALDDSGATRSSLVADQDGVVGHVRLSRGWVDAQQRLVEVLVLTPLAVAPGCQRRGVGTALLAGALAEAERLGAPAVFLEGSWRYYGPRGFAPATEHGFERPSVRIPEPAFQVVLLAGYEEWMSGRLVYPDAVWEADCAGLR